MSENTEFQKELRDYKKELISGEQKSQESYDQTILTLSSGAFGISFAFIENLIKLDDGVNSFFLFSSWISWAISMLCVLFSYYFSALAMREMIQRVDDSIKKEDHSLLYTANRFDRFTGILNIASGVLFFLGVIFTIIFLWQNSKFTVSGTKKPAAIIVTQPKTTESTTTTAPSQGNSQKSPTSPSR